MKKKYAKPVIFELGSVSELTAGGMSNLSERVSTQCYDAEGRIVNHTFNQPKA